MELLGQQVGHCRVEALVGRGGMGDVYRGVDLVLGRSVALKVLAGPSRAQQEGRARFRREARMLARFQHPNVCQVFDLIEGDESDILVMEYLEGQTLREVMRTSLPLDRALDIAGQIAAVLAAAHAEHMVHRDLKPENVMLLPDGRVKVLDFGLARLVEAAGQAGSGLVAAAPTGDEVEGAVGDERASDAERLTRAGTFTGTLRYMSPEQAWGQEVGDASDMYSFGLVLRELVTGEPAYVCAGGVEQLTQQVRMAAVAPLQLDDPPLAELISRLTTVDPADRPSAAEVMATLVDLRDRPRRRRLRRRLGAGAIAMAGLLILTALATYRLTRPALWLSTGAAERAVLLPLVNATGDPRNAWLELGLQDMVVQTVSESLGGVLVSAADAAQVAGNLGVQGGAEMGDRKVSAVAAALGVEVVIGGEVRQEEGEFVLSFWACRPGGQAHRGQVRAPSLTELASRFVRQLELHLDPTAAAVELEQTYSADGLANLAYAMGVGALASDGARRARPYFEVSLDRDPGLPRARLQLSVCEEKLGDRERAVDLARHALEQARKEGQREVEVESLERLGSLARLRGDFAQAEEQLTAALSLAREGKNRVRQADCLNELGRLSLARLQVDEAASRFGQALALATAARDTPLEAKLLVNLGMVELRRGSVASAGERFAAALERARRLGDRDLELTCRTNQGMVALETDRLDEAETAFATARTLAAEVGNRDAELVALTNLGTVAVFRGQWPEAESRYREALAARVSLGDRPGQAKVLNNLGDMARRQGRFPEAAARWQEALAIRTELGDARGQALVLINLGALARVQGHLTEARHRVERARALLEGSGDRRYQAAVLVALGEVALDQGLNGEARQRLDSARALQPDLPEGLRLEGRLACAEGDRGRGVEVLTAARRALRSDWLTEDDHWLERCRGGGPG